MIKKILEVHPGMIGAAIYGNLISIGHLEWRFLYKCGHFAPDHLQDIVNNRNTRSAREMCILCVEGLKE